MGLDKFSLDGGAQGIQGIQGIQGVKGDTGPGFTSTQLTKLGVIGSVGSPNQTNITIPSTSDFNRPSADVLKFIPAATNVVSTLMAFNNGDSTSFAADTQLVFDGTMHEKTIYQSAMTDGGILGSGELWSFVINKASYKTIEKVEVV